MTLQTKDPALRQDALASLRAGASCRAVASATGIPLTTVRRWARAAGLGRGRRHRAKRSPRQLAETAALGTGPIPAKAPGLRERALALLRGGMPCREVAREFGAGPTTIRRWAKQAGILLRVTSGSQRRVRAWADRLAPRAHEIRVHEEAD